MSALTIAAIVVVSKKRIATVRDKIIPAILPQGFDEVFWVGDGEPGDGYRFLHVPDLSKTTNDALVKRDVGTLASQAEVLLYLCDDHRPAPDFVSVFRDFTATTDEWDIIGPGRFTMYEGRRVPLNMGWNDPRDPAHPYLGGHGGVFRRRVITHCPWTARQHDRLWDVLTTKAQIAEGFRLVGVPDLLIEDLEPEAQPWR